MIRLIYTRPKLTFPSTCAGSEKGETIILCERNVPIAEIRPIKQPLRAKRPIGLYKGKFTVPPSFFEPLPDWLLDAFEGKESK